MICIGYPCPHCGEYGGIYAAKNKKDGKLWAYCDECDTLWRNIEDVDNDLYIDENWQEVFEWDGYATIEEIEAFGWGKYIKSWARK